jgi:hypothetical protein
LGKPFCAKHPILLCCVMVCGVLAVFAHHE